MIRNTYLNHAKRTINNFIYKDKDFINHCKINKKIKIKIIYYNLINLKRNLIKINYLR